MTDTEKPVEALRALLAKASAAPWFYRPDKYDDWGFIRGGERTEFGLPVVALGRSSNRDDDHDAHRYAGTDPYGDNAKAIVALRNHAEPLLDALTAAQQEIARLREALGQVLCCTPHIRAGEIIYDCGDPYDIARKALEPSGETR